MDEALELVNYLPSSFKSDQEIKYIELLWESFEQNYENGNRQFAFLAYHMLFMSFVYFTIWKIRKHKESDVHNVAIGFGGNVEKSIRSMQSPFAFSEIQERSVFRFLKLINCSDGDIGQYVKMVKKRNKFAHANGNITTSMDGLDLDIRDIVRHVGQIEKFGRSYIERIYITFLWDSIDETTRQYSDDKDQIREALAHENYLSFKDIEACLNYNVMQHCYETRFEVTKRMHEVFRETYADIA